MSWTIPNTITSPSTDQVIKYNGTTWVNGAAPSGGGGGTWGSITGTLSSQTDLQTALDGKQAVDSDLTTIAGLTATTDNFIQAKSSAWASRTVAQVKVDLGLTGTNSGDETASTLGATLNASSAATPNDTDIVATAESSVLKKITWTNVKAFLKTYFDTLYTAKNGAITGATKTKVTYDSKGLVTAGADATTADIADSTNKRYVTDAQLTVIGSTSGSNSGDQTTIAGFSSTKSEFDTACSDGDFLYVGDVVGFTDEAAQDAIGAMVDSSLVYQDAVPQLSRAALTGDVTAGLGSNSTTIGANVVTNAKAAQMAANTIKGNNTGSTANAVDMTVAQAKTLLSYASISEALAFSVAFG